MNIYPAYISKRNSNHEKKNQSKRRRMALSYSKKALCIIKRNNVKACGDFYRLSCINLFRTKK